MSSSQDPIPPVQFPVRSELRTIQVSVPDSFHKNASKMKEVMDQVLGKLGCSACHSGYDIRFARHAELTVLAKGASFEIRTESEQ